MAYFPTRFGNVYLIGTGSFLPGSPVDNESMDGYIAPINNRSRRIKQRILNENGIETRYYGIDAEGNTTHSAAQMGVSAIDDGLRHAGRKLDEVTLLTAATSGGDVLMPGFANMLQGELRAQPMEVRSHHGICASGIGALKDAAQSIELGSHEKALVAAVEFPSRLFNSSRFAPMGYEVDFNAHFLRWMLSDGAGSVVLSREPDGNSDDIALQLDWLHTKSFSGDYPVCMQLGNTGNDDPRSFMDYGSFAEAEAQGALALRQDIRLLPHLFEVGIHELSELVRTGWVDPLGVDHFLLHYSSEKLGGVFDELATKAGIAIPRERWFSNLKSCGNTGSASFYIMLRELVREKRPKPGEKIFCIIPESGRFTVAFMMLTVVPVKAPENKHDEVSPEPSVIAAPHEGLHREGNPQLGTLLRELASIWHDYRSRVWRSRYMQALHGGDFHPDDYINWMENWIPQVREGSLWMRAAISSLSPRYKALHDLIELHAGEEQNGFKVLFEDYRNAGGGKASLDDLRRNPGGEALNAFMHRLAVEENPLGLLGGIYIIEGTGQRIIPAILPRLRQRLPLPNNCFQFLKYHGENDPNHLARWLSAVELALTIDPAASDDVRHQITTTARQVADLYLMQWEFV